MGGDTSTGTGTARAPAQHGHRHSTGTGTARAPAQHGHRHSTGTGTARAPAQHGHRHSTGTGTARAPAQHGHRRNQQQSAVSPHTSVILSRFRITGAGSSHIPNTSTALSRSVFPRQSPTLATAKKGLGRSVENRQQRYSHRNYPIYHRGWKSGSVTPPLPT